MPDRELIRSILFGSASAMSAVVFVMLLLDSNRPLGPVLALVAVVVLLWVIALWLGWRK